MTPFDTALRVQRREVDAVRVAITAAVELSDTASAATTHHDVQLQQERATLAAAAAWLPSTDAWTARMKIERLRLVEQQKIAEARLSGLRAQAAEVYGKMRAIEGAADRFRTEAERAAEAAEQAGIDDIAAARFLKTLREQRRRRG